MKFSDARAKIGRANKHIAEMDALLSTFQNSDAYTVREIRDSQTGQKFIEYGFAKRISVEDLALVIGDAVHNLKCALDYAWIHTIKKLAPTKTAHAKFPIFSSRAKLEDALHGIEIQISNPDLYNLIVTHIKPYDGGDLCLWSIHSMDISDKHRLLTPLLSVAVTDLAIEDDKGKVSKVLCVFTRMGPYRKFLEENEKLKDKGDVRLRVVFQKTFPETGVEVSPVLHNFSKLVLSVVETLERFLET
jgi:hypothetical protein